MTRWWRSPVLHGAGGFALMGAWAAFANRAFAMPAPIVAAMVQGTLTAAITLVMKRLIEMVSDRTRGAAGYALPPLFAALFSATLLTLAHSLARTPAFWATIAVPFSVASLYAILYTITLRRGAT